MLRIKWDNNAEIFFMSLFTIITQFSILDADNNKITAVLTKQQYLAKFLFENS